MSSFTPTNNNNNNNNNSIGNPSSSGLLSPIPLNFNQQQTNTNSLSSSTSNLSPTTPSTPIHPSSNAATTNTNSNVNTTTTTTTTPSTNTSSTASFMDIFESWRQFSIEKKKIDLDEFVNQIANLKEDCLSSRKVLAKQTQEFKKVADEEKLKTFGQLLKLYQDEVDKLTKRSKYSESCFFGIYKDLSELHDPVPALKAALDEYAKVDQTSKLEIENKKLQIELNDFRKEFQEIQNQEVTIRRLEDRIKEYEMKSEHSTLEKVSQRENELKLEYKSKIHTLKDRNNELTRQISQLQDDLNKITKQHDNTQSNILDINLKYEEALTSKQSEIEMLTNEIDRVTSKLTTLQRENSSIREESLKEKNSITPLVKKIADLELELLQKDGEFSKSNEQQMELKQQLKEEKLLVDGLNTKLEIEKQKVEKMEKHIQNNPSPADYESIKKELETLQAIVGSDEINNIQNYNSNNSSNNNQGDKIFKDKIRQLENESTKLRLSLSASETEALDYKAKVEQLEIIKLEQSSLIHKLEDYLSNSKGNTGNQNSNGNSGNVGGDSKNQLQEDLLAFIQNSPTLNISNSQTITNNNSINSLDQNTTVKDDKVLDIVIGQRDRFKSKILELENDKNQMDKQLDSIKIELSSLKQDNIKLYEKIRFLQSYDKNSGNSSRSKKGIDNNNYSNYDLERGPTSSSSSSSSSTDSTEMKYDKLYEDSINPFTSFNKKEKYRRYKEMNTAERVILNTSRFFLSNKYSRIFLFVYSISLHLLVFITLYRLAITTQEIHDGNYNNDNDINSPQKFNMDDINITNEK